MIKSLILGCVSFLAALVCVPAFTSLAATAYPAKWDISAEDNAPCWYLSSDAHTGKYSFAHAMDKKFTVATWQEVQNIPNQTYTVSAYVKSSGGQENCWVSVKDYGGKEQQLHITFSDEWTQISLSDIVVTKGKATISLWTESKNAAWALVDDITFTDASGKNYIVNGGFEEISKESVALDAKPDKAPPTKVVTRFFEKWTIYAEPTADVAFTTTGGHTGKYCGAHYSKNAKYAVSTAQLLAGLPNGKYGGSVWVKNSGGQTSATLVLTVTDPSTGKQKKYNKDLPVTDKWTKVEQNDIEVTGGTLEISVWSDSPAGCWIKFDDMAVYNMSNTGKNLLPNSGFETLGTAPEIESEANTGAEGAAGNDKVQEKKDSSEEGGMELNEDDGSEYDVPVKEAGPAFQVDIVLVSAVGVILLCFAASIVTLILVLKQKKKEAV